MDKGFKFIPNYNLNPLHFFNSIIINLENEIYNLNKQFFLKEQFLNNSKNTKISNECITLTQNEIDDFVNSDEESFLNDNFTYESLENFFLFRKKLNTKNNLDHISLSKDCIFLQLELFKELNNIKFNFKQNLTTHELNILKKFITDKPFRVVELDKNVGSGIISNELYDELTLQSLSDIKVYKELDYDPLEESIDSVTIELNELFLNRKISNRLRKSIKINGKLGSFRILPKIHKSTFSTRPIFNYKGQFLNDLCYLLDFLIRPYVMNSESYIKDSQNLIQKIKNLKIPEDFIIATADFISLYSNINHDDCLFILTDFFRDKLDSEHIKIEGFHSILKIVLNNNFFKFNNKFFKQTLGIAMGASCGPSIANLFVYI